MKVLFLLAALVAPALVSARLPYIVGGQDVERPGKYPWQVSLQMYQQHICGAAVISDTFIVTAAHCVGAPAHTMTVVLGMHDKNRMYYGKPKRYSIAKITKHPNWSENPYNGFPNDIAIIEVNGPMVFDGKYAKVIKMADEGESFLGNKDCLISGWGKLGGKWWQGTPNTLQYAMVDVYTRDTCRAKHGNVIQDYHVCVGKKGKSGACNGDSGGPLVCKVGGEYKLVGVTSFGLATCSVDYPSVYSRISYFRSFIKDVSGL